MCLYINLRLKLTYIDKIRNSKHRMLKQIMKCAGKMQVFRQFAVKTLDPV